MEQEELESNEGPNIIDPEKPVKQAPSQIIFFDLPPFSSYESFATYFKNRVHKQKEVANPEELELLCGFALHHLSKNKRTDNILVSIVQLIGCGNEEITKAVVTHLQTITKIPHEGLALFRALRTFTKNLEKTNQHADRVSLIQLFLEVMNAISESGKLTGTLSSKTILNALNTVNVLLSHMLKENITLNAHQRKALLETSEKFVVNLKKDAARFPNHYFLAYQTTERLSAIIAMELEKDKKDRVQKQHDEKIDIVFDIVGAGGSFIAGSAGLALAIGLSAASHGALAPVLIFPACVGFGAGIFGVIVCIKNIKGHYNTLESLKVSTNVQALKLPLKTAEVPDDIPLRSEKLHLTSPLPDFEDMKVGTLYIEKIEKNKNKELEKGKPYLAYKAKSGQNNEILISGTISREKLGNDAFKNIKDKPSLNSMKQQILNITFERGHTCSWDQVLTNIEKKLHDSSRKNQPSSWDMMNFVYCLTQLRLRSKTATQKVDQRIKNIFSEIYSKYITSKKNSHISAFILHNILLLRNKKLKNYPLRGKITPFLLGDPPLEPEKNEQKSVSETLNRYNASRIFEKSLGKRKRLYQESVLNQDNQKIIPDISLKTHWFKLFKSDEWVDNALQFYGSNQFDLAARELYNVKRRILLPKQTSHWAREIYNILINTPEIKGQHPPKLSHEDKIHQMLSEIDDTLSQYYQKDIAIPLLQGSSNNTLDNCYIHLTLIDRKEQKQHEEVLSKSAVDDDKEQEYVKNYEVLYQQDSPIELNQLWQSESYHFQKIEHSPKHLVIRGPAGIGKTTMLRCLALHWARTSEKTQESFKVWQVPLDISNWRAHFALLLHVPLRKLSTYTPRNMHLPAWNDLSPNGRRLAEFFEYLYGNLHPEHIIWLARSLSSKQENDPRILLLLDGLDEISALLEENFASESNIVDAVKQQQHEDRYHLLQSLLDHKNWLLTTRPHLADHPKLNHHDTHHLALTGFNSNSKKHYIEQYFRAFEDEEKEKKIEPVLTWLNQPHLYELTGVPLQLELLCYLASRTDNFQSWTQDLSLTELYAELFTALSKRFLEKYPNFLENHPNLGKAKPNPKKLNKKQIFSLCQEPIIWLSEFALEMMFAKETIGSFSSMLSKTIFEVTVNQNLEQKERMFEAAFENFGVLTPYDAAADELDNKLYYFQHLTYQEFLAAYALVQRLLVCSKKEKDFYINKIQSPFYHRMQIFIVGLLSQSEVTEIFLPKYEYLQRHNIVDALLKAAMRPLGNIEEWSFFNVCSILPQHQKEKVHKQHLFHLLDASLPLALAKESSSNEKLILPPQKNLIAKVLIAFSTKEISIKESLNNKKIPLSLQENLLRKIIRALDTELEKISSLRLKNEKFAKSHEMHPYGISFLSKRILQTNEVKISLERALRLNAEDALKLIQKFDCALPEYLEKYLCIATESNDLKLCALAVQTILKLGRYASEEIQLKLINYLQNKASYVRICDDAILWSWFAPHASDKFKTALGKFCNVQEPINIQITAAMIIGAFGRHANETLQFKLATLCEAPEPDVRIAVAKAIGNLGQYSSEELQLKLVVLMKAQEPNVQKAAAKTIKQFKEKWLTQTTKQALKQLYEDGLLSKNLESSALPKVGLFPNPIVLNTPSRPPSDKAEDESFFQELTSDALTLSSIGLNSAPKTSASSSSDEEKAKEFEPDLKKSSSFSDDDEDEARRKDPSFYLL